jgi:preprotein translocase subunit YajC
MWSNAYAQAASGPPPAGSPIALFAQFGWIILVFAVMYLLLIRPQQQQQKKMQAMLKALKKGDRVVTTGGIIGSVVGVEDAKVVLKVSDEVKLEFLKSAVVQVLVDKGA